MTDADPDPDLATDPAESPSDADPNASPDEEARRTAVLAARARDRATEKLRQAEAWVAETDQRRTAWDTVLAVRDRDRDAFASVLGSAIALRLFLFSAALVVALVSLGNLLFGRWGLSGALGSAGLTAEMAQEVARAARPDTGRDLWVLLSSLVVALTSGRSLTVVLAVVQWFMHYYLPYRIESASETMGSLGATVASLGYLFVIGRVMAGTVVLNAVIYEQIGSISVFVFELPGLQRLPVRFPGLRTYFDLDHPRDE